MLTKSTFTYGRASILGGHVHLEDSWQTAWDVRMHASTTAFMVQQVVAEQIWNLGKFILRLTRGGGCVPNIGSN